MRAEVPLVSEVEAGNYTVIDNFKPTGTFDTVPVTVPIKRHTYALRVHGDSMVSDGGDSFPEGSIIIVEPEMEALPGDYVIALNSRQRDDVQAAGQGRRRALPQAAQHPLSDQAAGQRPGDRRGAGIHQALPIAPLGIHPI